MSSSLERILETGDKRKIRPLFELDRTDSVEEAVFKFNVWGRYFFPKFYKREDATFHAEIDEFNYKVYQGSLKFFVDIAFRGAAKTTRTKLFIAYAVSNDANHFRKYVKVLSEDRNNAKQSVTDVYNLLINQRLFHYYPEIFEKTQEKREETMASFTTATGVKMRSDTVGTDQRGDIQEDSRPDFIWFDDFETRKTLRSAVETQSIWDNMEEAKDGLAKDGGAIYTCNYLSERGNVHKLVEREGGQRKVLITPIKKDGKPTWNAYTIEDINAIEADADDFAGEYLCQPALGKDVLFDRTQIDAQAKLQPIKEVAGFRIYKEFDPSHRFGAGADVAGGVGLDSSASVFIDFDTIPAQVAATYDNNEIKPEVFGDELARQGEKFGECLIAPENNKFDSTIGRLKQIYPLEMIYNTEKPSTRVQAGKITEYGWNTNGLTKPKMLFALAKAVDDGLLALNCPKLIAECRSYTRNDLMDAEVDPRLTTRHFDLLIAAAIAWQLKDHARLKSKKDTKPYKQPEAEPNSLYIG